MPTDSVKVFIETFESAGGVGIIPEYAHDTDAGCDLISSEDVIVSQDTVQKIHTGIKVAIPKGYYAQVLPRSGVSTKTRLRVIPGVIDAGYRGEVRVMVELMPVSTFNPAVDLNGVRVNGSENEIFIRRGDKIAQMIIKEVPKVEFLQVNDINEIQSDRGSDGFGSTGI